MLTRLRSLLSRCNKNRIRSIPIASINGKSEFTPPEDTSLSQLLTSSSLGKVEVFKAWVDTALVRPCAPGFNPFKHPPGSDLLEQCVSRMRDDGVPAIWVYPSHGKFVMSDDYLVYYAALQL
jgi:hypothetical protein